MEVRGFVFREGSGGELGLDHTLRLGGSPRVREGWRPFLLHAGEVRGG